MENIGRCLTPCPRNVGTRSACTTAMRLCVDLMSRDWLEASRLRVVEGRPAGVVDVLDRDVLGSTNKFLHRYIARDRFKRKLMINTA